MKRIFMAIVAFALFALYCTSCYYDSEEVLYPVFGCDSINVTYTKNISKIMTGYCISCHNDSYSESGVSLSTYEEVLTNEARVDLAIKHLGNNNMPPGGKLNDCMIFQWDLWRQDGMPK